jgi:hypothetical protein
MALVPGARLPETEQPEIDTAWTEWASPCPNPQAEAGENPEVLRQIRQLSGMINRKVAATRRANADVETLPGKKVAFTLRLDPRRHALLRACCTAERRSAQALLIEALDRLVDATPASKTLSRNWPPPAMQNPHADVARFDIPPGKGRHDPPPARHACFHRARCGPAGRLRTRWPPPDQTASRADRACRAAMRPKPSHWPNRPCSPIRAIRATGCCWAAPTCARAASIRAPGL